MSVDTQTALSYMCAKFKDCRPHDFLKKIHLNFMALTLQG